MRAIAAMSRNRVIGKDGAIPWRIRDEFRWFRQQTLGHVVVMGRRTFESLPKPLDGRVTVVLTHDPSRVAVPPPPAPEVRVVRGLDEAARQGLLRDAWLCGGASLYARHLPECSELWLSVVDREVEGDTFFPPFEHLFDLAGVAAEFPEFKVLRYVRNGAAPG